MKSRAKKDHQTDREEVVDVKELLNIIFNRKWLVVALTCLFAVIAFFYGLSRFPTYQSNLLVNVSNISGMQSISDLLSSNVPFVSNSAKNSLTSKMKDVFRSRAVLLPVIRTLHLDIQTTPLYFPVIGKMIANYFGRSLPDGGVVRPLMGLSQYNWGGASIKFNTFNVSKALYTQAFKLTYLGEGAYQLSDMNGNPILLKGVLKADYRLELNKGNALFINVSDIHANPGQQFEIKRLRDTTALNNLTQVLSIGGESKESNILKLSYQGHDPYLVAAILNLIGESAVTNNIERKSQNATQVLAFLKTQLPLVQKKLTEAQNELNAYRSKTGNLSIADETRIILQKLSGYDTQIANLELKLSQTSQVLTDRNPEFLQLHSAIEKVKTQRAALQRRIKALPKSDQMYVNLLREVEIQEKLYQTIISKVQQYEIIQAATVSSLEIIDSAHVPYRNINRPTSVLVILGAILGFFLAVIWIFLSAYLIKGLQDPEMIEAFLGIAFLGAVYSSSLQKIQSRKFRKKQVSTLKLIEEIDPYNIVIESFRSIRTSIDLKLLSANNKVITISGPTEMIGKSFVSANLAGVLCANKHKVLLIDADLRKGHLSHYFIPKPQYGLSHYLKDASFDTDRIIQKTRFESIDFIDCGEHSAHSTELLIGERFKALLETVKTKYDRIIIDTPPILPVADSGIILQHGGINLLVLKCSAHDKKVLRLMYQKIEMLGIAIDGFILNGITGTSTYYHKKYQYQDYA